MRGLARIAGNAMAGVLGLGEEVLLLAGGVARIRPIRRVNLLQSGAALRRSKNLHRSQTQEGG